MIALCGTQAQESRATCVPSPKVYGLMAFRLTDTGSGSALVLYDKAHKADGETYWSQKGLDVRIL